MNGNFSRSATDTFEVSSERWECCNHTRKSAFCQDCGKKRPDKQYSSRVGDMIAGWQKQKYALENSARKLASTRASIRQQMDAIKEATSIEELLDVIDQSSRRYLPEDIDSLEESKRRAGELAAMHLSQVSATCDGVQKKADQLGYWINTVEDLMAQYSRAISSHHDQ